MRQILTKYLFTYFHEKTGEKFQCVNKISNVKIHFL